MSFTRLHEDSQSSIWVYDQGPPHPLEGLVTDNKQGSRQTRSLKVRAYTKEVDEVDREWRHPPSRPEGRGGLEGRQVSVWTPAKEGALRWAPLSWKFRSLRGWAGGKRAGPRGQ